MAGRVLGAIAVAATAGLTVLALAIPASAHTPDVKAKCVKDEAVLTVNLSAYASKGNKITVLDGDTELLQEEFGKSFEKTFKASGTVEHTFTVTVKASDGDKYDFKKTLKTEKCVKEQPPTKPQPPVSSSSEVPPTTTTTEAPPAAPPAGGSGQAEPPLAATGASTTWTLLAGLGLVGAGAAALILVRRKRA
jgi:LPXTG-motif cell wall-anchored protein